MVLGNTLVQPVTLVTTGGTAKIEGNRSGHQLRIATIMTRKGPLNTGIVVSVGAGDALRGRQHAHAHLEHVVGALACKPQPNARVSRSQGGAALTAGNVPGETTHLIVVSVLVVSTLHCAKQDSPQSSQQKGLQGFKAIPCSERCLRQGRTSQPRCALASQSSVCTPAAGDQHEIGRAARERGMCSE